MSSFLRTGNLPVLVLVAIAAATAPTLSAPPQLSVKFGVAGITSLLYDQTELLAPGSAPGVSVCGPDGKPLKLAPVSGETPQADGIITQSYDNLTVITNTRQTEDSLDLTVTYKNTGTQAITKIEDTPLLFHFPRRPKGGSWKWGYDVTVDIEDAPGVITADWGAGKLVACVEPGSSRKGAADMARPMTIGFQGNYGNNADNRLLFRTTCNPALEPGKSWTFRGSLRFASSSTPTADVAKDIYAKFAKAFPPRLKWPDRRPIGAIMIANSAQHWPTNPRGWFNDPTVDITTDEGRAAFRDRLMKYADQCVAVIKDTGGQGMIFWDLEGGEMPHAITYMGDPRIIPKASPEMDAAADAFFKKFLDAGLRTGLCIRPSKIIPNPQGGWKHQQSEDHVSDMADKIAYAKKRWGCTIFYMDTNVKWPMNPDPADETKGMWQGNASVLPAADLRELTRRHPDVLIAPEFARFGYYGVSGAYGELRGGQTGVNPDVRLVYPAALMVLQVGEIDMILDRWDDLRAGVAQGTIPLFRGWFGDPVNTLVKRICQEVDFARRGSAIKTDRPLDVLLADPDPLVRFTAVSRLDKPTAAQTLLLIKCLGSETEWVVQHKIVDALGASGDAAALPVLADILKDPKTGLDRFAGQALGQIGAPATPLLIGLATGQDPRLVTAALTAFAQYDDPAATPTLLTLSADPAPAIRSLAANALARRPDAAVNSRLAAMLSDTDPRVLIAVCRALAQTKDRAALKPLVELIERSVTTLHDNTVREAAGDALEAITGLQYGPFEQKWKPALENNQ